MDELEEMRTRAGKWTLADDSKLITVLSSLVDSILDRSSSFSSSIQSTSSSITHLHSSIDTTESAIGLYSGTQFVEQRVMEDDYRPRKPSQPEKPLTLQERQSIILEELRSAVRQGLNVIDTQFTALGEKDDPFIQYAPIDRFNRNVLPLVGSAEFHAMRKKRVEVKEPIRITVDEPKVLPSPIPPPSSLYSPSIGISAYPPATVAPPPPPPPLPPKLSPSEPILPSRPSPSSDDLSPFSQSGGQSALQREIASTLLGRKGEFVVPHDHGPDDVDSGLTPLPSTRRPQKSEDPPIIQPRVGQTQPPELPPKKSEEKTTSSLPAEPKKKSIFDFDSDDDDFATVLSRPTKPASSSSTLSSSMRSEENEQKGDDEKKGNQLPSQSSLVAELASAAAAKRAKQLAGNNEATPRPSAIPSIEKYSTPSSSIQSTPVPSIPPTVRSSQSIPSIPSIPPSVSTTVRLEKEERMDTPVIVERKEERVEAVKKISIAKKKSIFDDEDSDFDELFKPKVKKEEKNIERKEEKKLEKKEKPVVEKRKVVEVPKPSPTVSVPAPKSVEKPQRRNLFDSDSDFEDLFKPKSSTAKKTPAAAAATPKEESKQEPPLVTEEVREKEETPEVEKQEKPVSRAVTPPPKTEQATKKVSFSPDPIVVKEEEKEEKKEEKEKKVEEEKEEQQISPSVAPETKEEEPVEEAAAKPVQPLPTREEQSFSPIRESPPPFEHVLSPQPSTEEPPASPFREVAETKSQVAPVRKSSSIRFDSPPPFEELAPEPEPIRDERHDSSSATEDSDTEVMQGNRAAFMAQLNAKLAAKPPSGMGVRPMSMVETSSTPFSPPLVRDRPAAPAPVRRAASEAKTEERGLAHANKSRPKGPPRRPPSSALKKIPSSSESEDPTRPPPPTTVSRQSPAVSPRPKSTVAAVTEEKKAVVPEKSTVSPKSTVVEKKGAISPKTVSPPPEAAGVVFRKTSNPKSPSSSSSSLGPDADPLSLLSAVHTSPYKGPSTVKPPISPSSRSTVKTEKESSKKDDPLPSKEPSTKPKKSVFDSDSDDFFEKIGGSKTLPAKNLAFKNELAAALNKEKKEEKKAPASSLSQKKGLFDDSDEDLDLFRKKK